MEGKENELHSLKEREVMSIEIGKELFGGHL